MNQQWILEKARLYRFLSSLQHCPAVVLHLTCMHACRQYQAQAALRFVFLSSFSSFCRVIILFTLLPSPGTRCYRVNGASTHASFVQGGRQRGKEGGYSVVPRCRVFYFSPFLFLLAVLFIFIVIFFVFVHHNWGFGLLRRRNARSFLLGDAPDGHNPFPTLEPRRTTRDKYLLSDPTLAAGGCRRRQPSLLCSCVFVALCARLDDKKVDKWMHGVVFTSHARVPFLKLTLRSIVRHCCCCCSSSCCCCRRLRRPPPPAARPLLAFTWPRARHTPRWFAIISRRGSREEREGCSIWWGGDGGQQLTGSMRGFPFLTALSFFLSLFCPLLPRTSSSAGACSKQRKHKTSEETRRVSASGILPFEFLFWLPCV